MALVTKDDVKLYLDQITGSAAPTAHDARLDAVCTRVEDIIALYLGFSFMGYGTATTKVVYGNGTPWLVLPPHEPNSVTIITLTGGTTEIDDWTEQDDGSLYLDNYSPYSAGWNRTRFTVTGKWGYGEWPASVKEVAIELAINIFRERDKGTFSDVIGVEGGGAVAIGYQGALTKRQKMILDLVKRKYQVAVFV